MHIDLRIHVNLHILIDLLPTESQFKLLSAEPRWVLRQGVPEFVIFLWNSLCFHILLINQNTQRQ